MSINKKIIFLLVSLFLFSSVFLIAFSLSSLRAIEEKQMDKVYTERLRILMVFIENRYDALLETGMADIYEEVYKKDLVRDLKQIYYKNVKQTYPFILDPDANQIMHPTILIENADNNENDLAIVNHIKNHKNGNFEYVWNGNHKWCIFREFKPWNWYVVFTVDDSVRYDVVYQYLYKYSGVLILVSGLIVLITLFILRKNLLDPLLLLKEKCKNVLDKDVSSDFIVLSRKKDEIGELASSFIKMEFQLKESRQKELDIAKEREQSIMELKDALSQVKHLKGMLPICANCKKIRDDSGYWQQVEQYVEKNTNAIFSHGLCPECSDELYGKEGWYIKMKKKNKQKD